MTHARVRVPGDQAIPVPVPRLPWWQWCLLFPFWAALYGMALVLAMFAWTFWLLFAAVGLLFSLIGGVILIGRRT